MNEVALSVLDIVLTAAANGLAQNFTVSDVMKAAHAAGHEITDEDLKKYVVAGSDALAALHAINVARKAV